MSAEATAWVFRHSPFKGTVFAVHLAIGDSVNDIHEHLFWMARANLATKARVSGESVSAAVAKLHEAGLIEPVDEGMDDPATRQRAGRPTRWRFLYPDETAVVYDSRRKTRSGSSATSVAADDEGGSGSPDTGSRNTRDVTQENPSQEPKAAKPRARFAEFDALVAAFGEYGTAEEAKFYAKVARSLQAQGKSPAEIEDRGKRARARHPDCTVNVLLTRWSNFGPPRGQVPGSTLEDLARRDREARTDAR
jgi:hypothetical protein